MWPWPAGGLQVVAVPSIPHQSPHEVAIGASLRHRAAWLCHSAHMLGPEMGTVSLPSGSRRGRRKLLMLQEGKSGAVLGLPESFLSSDSPDSRLRGAFLGSVSCPCQLLWCLSSVSPSPSPFPPEWAQATILALDLPSPPEPWGEGGFCPSLPTSQDL